MNFVSLFSGIGGFDLGLERAGMTCVAQVEIDAAASGVLSHHWPDVPRFDDVRVVDRRTLPACDLICGGFPCQDLSVAGQRAGLAGVRSGLFFEMVRVIHELRPAYVVWENVPGLLTSNHGRDFAAVLMALDGIGYRGAWSVLDARFFGLAQRRRRVFGVFTRLDSGAERAAEILSLTERMRWNPAQSGTPQQEIAGTLGSNSESGGRRTTDLDGAGAYIVGALSAVPPLKAQSGQSGKGDGAPLVAFAWNVAGSERTNIVRDGEYAGSLGVRRQDEIKGHFGVRRLTPMECERLQGFPDGWTAVNDQLDSPRYKQLGNAVAVPVIEWIGHRIMTTEIARG
jgi:DNA (cytosine-5)-methyltransferase 1